MKIILFLILLFPSANWACSCTEATDEEAYNKSKSVILVKITNTKLLTDKNNDEFVQANFKVIEPLKGNRGKIEIIQSTVNRGCSSALLSGYIYLIYSNGEKIKNISQCSRSRWINDADERALIQNYRAKK